MNPRVSKSKLTPPGLHVYESVSLEEQIAQRAYELWQQRGHHSKPGSDWTDWFHANGRSLNGIESGFKQIQSTHKPRINCNTNHETHLKHCRSLARPHFQRGRAQLFLSLLSDARTARRFAGRDVSRRNDSDRLFRVCKGIGNHWRHSRCHSTHPTARPADGWPDHCDFLVFSHFRHQRSGTVWAAIAGRVALTFFAVAESRNLLLPASAQSEWSR